MVVVFRMTTFLDHFFCFSRKLIIESLLSPLLKDMVLNVAMVTKCFKFLAAERHDNVFSPKKEKPVMIIEEKLIKSSLDAMN